MVLLMINGEIELPTIKVAKLRRCAQGELSASFRPSSRLCRSQHSLHTLYEETYSERHRRNPVICSEDVKEPNVGQCWDSCDHCLEVPLWHACTGSATLCSSM